MVIIESEQHLDDLCALISGGYATVIPLMTDFTDHPCVNKVCLVSVMTKNEHYIIPFQHNDAINLPYNLISKLSTSSFAMATPDKKIWTHLFGHDESNILDMNGIEYLTTGKLTSESTFYTSTMKKMYSIFRKQKNINKAIPLMDLVKYFEAVHAHMTKVYMEYFVLDGTNRQISVAVGFHSNVIIPSLVFIEKSGLYVDVELFKKHYPNKERNIHDGFVYTEYNPYSLTGRITNTFGGINYAALSTKDGTRDTFVSRFGNAGTLVSLDYTSFHPLIIAELIGYTFSEPVYQFLAKQYFNVLEPTEEEIQASKIHTMKLLYDDTQPTSIEFIQKMYEYRDSIWEKLQTDGHIYSSTGRKIRLSAIDDPTPGKVLSYVIQCREMEITMTAISKLFPLFWNDQQYQSRVVLYTYDSILLDFCLKDGPDFLKEIIGILEQNGRFPVKIEAGPSFGNLKNMTELVKKSSLEVL